jgi:hypothetical protein
MQVNGHKRYTVQGLEESHARTPDPWSRGAVLSWHVDGFLFTHTENPWTQSFGFSEALLCQDGSWNHWPLERSSAFPGGEGWGQGRPQTCDLPVSTSWWLGLPTSTAMPSFARFWKTLFLYTSSPIPFLSFFFFLRQHLMMLTQAGLTSLCSSGWLQTGDPPASASWVTGITVMLQHVWLLFHSWCHRITSLYVCVLKSMS